MSETKKFSNQFEHWNENSDSCFRFNNPKQFSNWIILVSFYSSHLAIKIATIFILWKLKKLIKNSKKFVYYNEELVTNSKFQTQLSRKLQRFRTCIKTKNASFFMIFLNISFFNMVVNYWTGSLIYLLYVINNSLKWNELWSRIVE